MAIELGLGFEITELRLGLPGGCGGSRTILLEKNEKKRAYSEVVSDRDSSNGGDDQRKSARTTKNEGDGVVGWPPVCSYRKKSSFNGRETNKMYVKVSMDGAPFLRKINLSSQNGYSNLVTALEKLFGCFGIAEAMKDADNSEFVPIFEDKDGDWMLVGDVPWEMFSESCKRLRIMKRSDAKVIGLQTKCFLKGSTKDEYITQIL